MDLNEARKIIDRVDKELVQLIEERMEAVVEVGKYKREHNLPVLDTNREKVVLDKVKTYTKNSDFDESVAKIFQAMMDVTKEYQENNVLTR